MADAGKVRYLFVDLLRGWAVLLMIEGHVVNSSLRPDLKETDLFAVIHFLNGAVAPAFLFMAGFTFAVSSRRKWEEYLKLGFPLFRQVGRLVFVLLLAYALHLPYFSLRKIIREAKPEDLASFFQVDILHTIAVSLLILLLALLIVRRERWLRYTSIALAAVVVFTTPVVWDYDFTKVFSLPIASYFNVMQRSVFPLFPWAAFVFCGTFTSQLFLAAQQSGREGTMMVRLLWSGIAIIVSGLLLDPVLVRVYRTYDFWHTSPSFFMIRLGIVMTALTVMYWYEKNFTRRSLVMQTIGQESLFVYALHIVIVYGSAIRHRSLVQIYGASLSFTQSLAVFLGLAFVTCLIAYFWHYVKVKSRLASRWIQYATIAVFLYHFFTRPY
jgi:uncharacterized membrane protein